MFETAVTVTFGRGEIVYRGESGEARRAHEKGGAPTSFVGSGAEFFFSWSSKIYSRTNVS